MYRVILGLVSFFLFVAVVGLVPQSCKAQALRDQAGPYRFEVLVDGRSVPVFRHNGETYVMGRNGARYTLRIHNDSNRRIEAVASVDGLDVIDGKKANSGKRGYLVEPWSSVDIDGWRLSEANVAAFRFSSVADSYAARTGSARNVGVIGVAVFQEKEYAPPPVVYVPEAPYYDEGYDDYSSNHQHVSPKKTAPAAQPSLGRASGHAASAKASESLARDRRAEERPGLGTEFGEVHGSWVQHVEFVRANAHRPDRVLGARYNDRQGLIAMGVFRTRRYSEAELRRTAQPFSTYSAPPRDWQWGY